MHKDALNEKRSAAHQRNPEPIRQYKREVRARERAKLTPEQRSAQRWLKWRQQQKQLAPLTPGPHGLESPAQTPDEFRKPWLALRAAEQEKALTATRSEKSTSKRSRQNQLDRDDRDDRHTRQRRVALSLDYGPEF